MKILGALQSAAIRGAYTWKKKQIVKVTKTGKQHRLHTPSLLI